MNDGMEPRTLDRAVAAIGERYVGPGGAVAVLREGQVLAQHCWGWADLEKRIPFTPQSHALICSITKQFTCALLLDQFPDPDMLDGDVRAALPLLETAAPRTRDLCNNQSGMRDYWATAMLCGPLPEDIFGEEDAARLIGRTRTLQFEPGTRYSYTNQNFRILANIIERRGGAPFGDLLRRRIFDRVGMPHALVNADTSAVQGGTIGYEGSLQDGFRAAINRIRWTGDASIAATLEDMIAWERFIDATREDADGLYRRISAPPRFKDGAPASYGFGLGQYRLLDRPATSHAGGLRGWRSFRCYLPEERVSVVVLFNHMADPRAAAMELLAATTGMTLPDHTGAPAAGWDGRFEEPETGLATRIESTPDGRVRLHYSGAPELLAAAPDGFASANTRLRREGDAIVMERIVDHQASRLLPCAGEPPADIEGRYVNDELGATLTVAMQGGVPYAACSGDLGQGAMQPLVPFAGDIWLLPCPRALDYSPPGDWTMKFVRDAQGRITGFRLGCWLARKLEYRRA
jgi:D-aminopeptidase